jgi:Tol biopolymer transport system component
MTTFERFERAIPELMTELSPARVPDYFDDMLQQTAVTRQRPAWSSLERWIPVGVIAQSVPLRPFPWRQLAVLALLGLLIAAGLVAYIGSPPRLPAPYGPARNGQVVFSTADGDIAAVDPTTGTITSLITGPTQDVAPWFSPDGRRFVFVRTVPDGEAYFVADADGSDARELVAPQVEWFDWSPGSDRIVVRHSVGDQGVASVVDVESGTSTPLDLGLDIQQPVWRPNHDQIVLASETSGERRFYLVDADGTDLRVIETAPGVVNLPSLSPDGGSIAYATWDSVVAGRKGRIHVASIDDGVDREPAWAGSAGTEELAPNFSPDGTKLLIERYEADTVGYRLFVVPVDGRRPEIALGESHPTFTDGASAMWSPDGRSILLTYNDDKTTWLYAADGTSAQQVTWTTSGALTWQRLAP